MAFLRAWCAVGLLVGAAGCGVAKQDEEPRAAPSSVGGVGVVDLDALAKRLGRDVEMSNSVQERMELLNGKLTTLQNSLKRLYNEKKESAGENPSEEQLRELQLMQARMDAQLLEKKRESESQLALHRQKLVEQFREQARPVLREVASARGLSIVVPRNNALLLTIDPAVEITDEVAERMLAMQAGRENKESGPEPPPETEVPTTSAR